MGEPAMKKECSHTFSLDAVNNVLLYADKGFKKRNDEWKKAFANTIAGAVLRDLKQELNDPSSAVTGTKKYYREYYDILSEYEGLDESIINELDSLTKLPRIANSGTRVEFYSCFTLDDYKSGIFCALVNDDKNLARFLVDTVILDAEADVKDPGLSDYAKVYYRRFFEVIEKCSLVDKRLKNKLEKLLKE